VIGLGSVGIFFSALTRRTGASTGLTFVATLVFTVGSLFLFVFLSSTAEVSSNGLRKLPPQAILWLNPFVAQADVACGTEDGGFGGSCSFISGILGAADQLAVPSEPTKPVVMPGNFGGGPVIIDDSGVANVAPGVIVGRLGGVGGNVDSDVNVAAVFDSNRDRFWPKTVISFLILAAVLTAASIQFVSPTRRWRPSLPGPLRRRIRRRSAT
jgi:hypothetical protein